MLFFKMHLGVSSVEVRKVRIVDSRFLYARLFSRAEDFGDRVDQSIVEKFVSGRLGRVSVVGTDGVDKVIVALEDFFKLLFGSREYVEKGIFYLLRE